MEGSALPVGIGSHQGIPGTGPLKRTPGNKGNLVGSTSHQTGNSQGKRRSFGAGDKGLPRVSERNLVFHERIQSLCIKRSSGVAQSPIRDMEAYTLELRKRIAAARERVAGVVRSYL